MSDKPRTFKKRYSITCAECFEKKKVASKKAIYCSDACKQKAWRDKKEKQAKEAQRKAEQAAWEAKRKAEQAERDAQELQDWMNGKPARPEPVARPEPPKIPARKTKAYNSVDIAYVQLGHLPVDTLYDMQEPPEPEPITKPFIAVARFFGLYEDKPSPAAIIAAHQQKRRR